MFFRRSLPFTLPLLLALLIAPARAEAQTPSNAATFENRLSAELGAASGLTSEQVAAQAVSTSWSVKARRAELLAAAADADRALMGYLPRVTLTARYTRLSEIDQEPLGPGIDITLPEPPLDQYSFQASLLVPVSDYFLRVAPSRGASVLAERAADQNLAATERSTSADAKTLYYNWVRARLNVLVAAQALEQAKATREDVRHALDAGTASQADLLRIDSRVAESEQLLKSSEHLADELAEELRIVRHDPEGTRYQIGEKIDAEMPGAAEDRRALTAYALSHRSELKALALRAKAAEKSADTERAGYLPRFELFGNANYDNPSSRVFPQRDEFTTTWNAGAQLSWVVSDIPGAAAAKRSADAQAAALHAERMALEDQVRREVSSALQSLLDARSAIETSGRGLAAAEESYRVRRVLFQNGRATSVELLDAELELTRARLDSVGARLDLRLAKVRLDYALGRDARDAKARARL